jgi:phage baseplate assembly protein W
MTLILANALFAEEQLGKGLRSPLVTKTNAGDFEGVSGEENLDQCLLDLVMTRVGERLMNEDLGSQMPAMLFENAAGVVDSLPYHATEVIKRFEPRVTNVAARARQTEPHVVELTISYTVRATGEVRNLVYPFYLQPSEG